MRFETFEKLLPGGNFTAADINEDGLVDNLDITPFVNLLAEAAGASQASGESMALGIDQASTSRAAIRSAASLHQILRSRRVHDANGSSLTGWFDDADEEVIDILEQQTSRM